MTRLPAPFAAIAAVALWVAIGPMQAAANEVTPLRLDRQVAGTQVGVVSVDRIVAVVNDQVVTLRELDERAAGVAAQIRRSGGQSLPEETLRRQVLERMVNDLIQAQLAKETGVRIDDATVDKTVQRIAEDNGMSLANFQAALQREGITLAKFRDDLRSELSIARLREREVDSAVIVTDAEVDTELARQARDEAAEVEFRLRHVLVAVPPQASPEQVESRRRRAVQALTELRQGRAFAEVAAAFSDAPDSLQGGDLGWRSAARLPPLFLEAIRRLKPGAITDVLRSANGFHVIRLEETRTAQRAAETIAQTRARHILIRGREGLNDTEIRERLARLRARVVTGEPFEELARVHSDDGSAQMGGDLGWISPGDTVPEFERAMDALKPGELSQPVQSPFGWHLIQVVERRSEAVSEDRKRAAARQAIRARKADEAYQDWLRQQRDRAFVQLRLEER